MSSIEESVKAMIPRMTEEIAVAIKDRALRSVEYSTSEAIAEEVKRYVSDIVMPLVLDDLRSQQDAIKAAILAACKGFADALAETLLRKMTDRLTGYEGDEILKDVFGPFFRGY